MHEITAKFRCLDIHLKWDERDEVELQPVLRRRKGEDVPDEENAKFWDSTPSGKARLWFGPGSSPLPFQRGAYYYLRFLPVDPKHPPADDVPVYSLESTTHRNCEGGEVYLAYRCTGKSWKDPGLTGAVIEMQISYQSSFDAFGQPGQRFTVDFVLAEPSDFSAAD